jgi:hypothetical protein
MRRWSPRLIGLAEAALSATLQILCAEVLALARTRREIALRIGLGGPSEPADSFLVEEAERLIQPIVHAGLS